MIALWYGILAVVITIYIVLDGRNFGVGYPPLDRSAYPGGAPAGDRRRRPALVMARSLAGRHRRGHGDGVPASDGGGIFRVLSRAVSDPLVRDPARGVHRSRRAHGRPALANRVGRGVHRQQRALRRGFG